MSTSPSPLSDSLDHATDAAAVGSTDPALAGAGFGTLSVAAILSESARRTPESVALFCMGAAITYRELWDQTRAYAGALRDRGVRPGDRVAMAMPNVPDFPRVYYAVLALGAVVVPIHPLFKAEEVEYVLRDSGAAVVVAAAPLLAEVGPAAARSGVPLMTVLVPDEMTGHVPFPRLEDEASSSEPIERYTSTGPLDAATVLYTSGTTGAPKGSVASHLALVEQVNVALIDALDIRSDDVLFGGLPLFHSFGQTAVMNIAFRKGAAVILLPRFEGAEVLRLLVEHGATIFTAVPTMYIGLLQAAAQNPQRPAIRFAVSGGAALPTSLLDAFQETFGASIHEGYGLTETSPTVSFNSTHEPIRPGTVGRPYWGIDVDIADAEIDDRIELLPPGTLGEIVVRGHALFKGYLGRPEATAEAVVDGWFRTGDLGTRSDDAIVTIVDRKKDMIVRNGYNVYPTEVEQVLMRHPSVTNIAVFGVVDDERGQEVHAAVIPADASAFDEKGVVEYAREHLAAYKYPRVVHVVDELPLGPSGKVLKRELVARYTAPAQE
jgi:long-chain acyl-CoA synthetase